MNQNEKRWIAILVIVIVIVIVLLIIFGLKKGNQEEIAEVPQNEQQTDEQYTIELDDGTKINTSEEFNSSKTFGDFEVSNIQYTTRPDGITVLLADVTNKGTTRQEEQKVTIKILDADGEVMTEIHPLIDAMEPGETVKINASVTTDISNARDFTIEANK